jgi:hypothetical protein
MWAGLNSKVAGHEEWSKRQFQEYSQRDKPADSTTEVAAQS